MNPVEQVSLSAEEQQAQALEHEYKTKNDLLEQGKTHELQAKDMKINHMKQVYMQDVLKLRSLRADAAQFQMLEANYGAAINNIEITANNNIKLIENAQESLKSQFDDLMFALSVQASQNSQQIAPATAVEPQCEENLSDSTDAAQETGFCECELKEGEMAHELKVECYFSELNNITNELMSHISPNAQQTQGINFSINEKTRILNECDGLMAKLGKIQKKLQMETDWRRRQSVITKDICNDDTKDSQDSSDMGPAICDEKEENLRQLIKDETDKAIEIAKKEALENGQKFVWSDRMRIKREIEERFGSSLAQLPPKANNNTNNNNGNSNSHKSSKFGKSGKSSNANWRLRGNSALDAFSVSEVPVSLAAGDSVCNANSVVGTVNIVQLQSVNESNNTEAKPDENMNDYEEDFFGF